MGPPARLKVVLVGGSAGSLMSMRALFRALPADCAIAFLVVQHRVASTEDSLHAVLGRWAPMPVVDAEHVATLEPGRIHVVPAWALATLRGERLELERADSSGGVGRPIDHLCRSLAAEHGRDAALVVLSGMLDDGTAGGSLVKAAGGLVLAEAVESAGYGGMPESAVEAGVVDQILPAARIGAALVHWARFGTLDDTDAEGALPVDEEYHAILELLRAHAPTDPSVYKSATLRRRIARRQALSGVADLTAYRRRLEQDELELERLVKDLVIGVTEFFRDPDAFEILETVVVPALCSGRASDATVRVWVAACSTGEEAYSVAILFREWRDGHPDAPEVQIFATDVDQEALARARDGLYPPGAVGAIPPARLERHFAREQDGYRIGKAIRESVVFAPHDITRDPPFSRLDLVVCRNLLIYLTQETQAKVLDLFRFVLSPGGYLFLGNSESLGVHDSHFESVSKRWRIYRHHAADAVRPPRFPIPLKSGLPRVGPGPIEVWGGQATSETGYRRLLAEIGPVLVLIDADREVVYVQGRSDAYLEVPSGEPTRALFKLVKPALAGAVDSAVSRAVREASRVAVSVAFAGPTGDSTAEPRAIRIEAVPTLGQGGEQLVLVTFGPEVETQGVLAAAGGSDDWGVRQLERELEATREDLHRTIEQSRSSSEEMRAAHEEVMAMNEELQSANEELESSKEELQSLNEELTTSNAELEVKMNEVEILNTDLHNLLNSADTATLLLDRELGIRRFTPACTALMRVLPSDIGRPVDDLAHHFHDAGLVEDCRRVVNGLWVPDREIRGDPTGWYLRRIRPYRTSAGDVAGVVVTLPDITALKRAESTLRESEERLRLFIGHVPVALAMFDRDMRYLAVSQRWLDDNGLHGRDVVGGLHYEMMPDTPEHWRAGHRRGLAGEVVRADEDRIDRPDGSTRWLRWEIRPWYATRAEVGGIVVFSEDITERKRAEAALRLSEERYRDLVQNASTAIIRWARDGRVTFVNEYAQSHFGWSADEMIGQPISSLLPASTTGDESPSARIRHAVEHPECYEQYINENVCRDGRRVWMRWTNRAIRDQRGEVVEILSVGSDVTGLKQAEDEVRTLNADLERRVEARTAELSKERERAEHLAAAKSEFLANMSHEIRTPLNAVLGFAEIGRRATDAAKVNAAFDRILSSGQLLLGIIDDILDYSKIEAGQLTLEQGVIDIAEVVERGYELTVEAAHAKGLELSMTIDPNLPATCRGDALRLTQVMLNLLSNAIKFTERGHVSLSATRDGEHLVLRVSDTGIGLGEGEMERLFEPFQQADSSTSRHYGGTGLGLTITKRIVDLMGGDIVVRSKVGEGSVFEARLPLIEAAGEVRRPIAKAKADRVASHGARLAGINVLAAEDNELNRTVLEELLSAEGARVVLVENGERAVAAVTDAGERAFDIVLMDVQMPGMDGPEATRRLRVLAPELPVLGLTAHALEDERRRCLEAGMRDRLTKPVRTDRLVDAILRHARRAASDDPDRRPSGSPPAWIDRSGLEARYAHRPGFAVRLLEIARRSNAERPRMLREAARAGDLEQIARLAHAIKGEVGEVMAARIVELAAQTEAAARRTDSEVGSSVDRLADALDAMLAELDGLSSRPPPSG
ncbi:MAG: PAS domain S-box protein [Ectothiorhodospiraceae bacterium]|nr:PAS domain S-box protein [Ectothiorhodospiraceae bacterium]